jgi:ABC-type multidrug transport system ATPase subunit
LGENDVIILDEPTMGIDFAVKKEIENIILREKEENKHLAIIISTCSLEFNFTDFIDKIWLIDQGKIIYNQSIENLAGEKDYIIGSLPFNFEDPRISDFQ